MMNMYGQSWKGTASLAKAFWLVYFVTGMILWMVVSFIIGMMKPELDPFFKQNLITSLVTPYTIFSLIAVWRCGKNSKMIWNVLSKIIVVLAALGTIFSLVQLFK